MDQNEKQQRLILMKGHPGCAKSTVSRALARALRCPVVDKDDIRDATLRLEASDRPAPPAPTLLNTLSYDIMWRMVETQLQIGLSVVVDCPLARPSLFQEGARLAQQYGCTLLVVECVARDLDEWKRRLETRARTALDPVFEDKMMCTSSRDSPVLPSSTCVEKSANVVSRREGIHDCCPESRESQSQLTTVKSIIDEGVFRSTDSDDLVAAVRDRSEKARSNWHKPSSWEDIEKLLEGYAKCYDYDTGLTCKIVIDTTSLSTEAAIRGILKWLKVLRKNSTKLVSSLP